MVQKVDNGGNGAVDRLTPKQAGFVQHWISTRYNGTQAARLAGYAGSDNTLAQMARQNLQLPKIQRAIAAKLAGHGGSAELVITELLDIALHADVSRFFEGAQLKHDNLEKYGRFVKSVHKTKDGWRVEVYSRLEALKDLARILQAGGTSVDSEDWAGKEIRVRFLGLQQQQIEQVKGEG